MKIYISGKISGETPESVSEKFNRAVAEVAAYGAEPVNPLDNGLHESEHWNKHMVADIAMLLECDGIYMLTDWEDSRGARIEYNIAKELRMCILKQPDRTVIETLKNQGYEIC